MLVVKDQKSKAMKAFNTKEKGSGDGEIVRKVQTLIDEVWGHPSSIAHSCPHLDLSPALTATAATPWSINVHRLLSRRH